MALVGICRSCEVARYLAEEAAVGCWSQRELEVILAGVKMWHRKCKGCECGCKERKLLPRLWPSRQAD